MIKLNITSKEFIAQLNELAKTIAMQPVSNEVAFRWECKIYFAVRFSWYNCTLCNLETLSFWIRVSKTCLFGFIFLAWIWTDQIKPNLLFDLSNKKRSKTCLNQDKLGNCKKKIPNWLLKPDGILQLKVPPDFTNTDLTVILMVQPVIPPIEMSPADKDKSEPTRLVNKGGILMATGELLGDVSTELKNW